MSAFHPIATKERTQFLYRLRAMCGRLRVGKENLHVAMLVGAAICSASHDGVSQQVPQLRHRAREGRGVG